MKLRSVILKAAAALLFSSSLGVVASDAIQTERYTKVSLEPSTEVKNPLDVIVNVKLPRQMLLVGESIEYLLARSGFIIRDLPDNESGEMYVMFALPIPSQHREMGTLRLSTALEMLAGEAYEMHTSKATREIWFTAKSEYMDELVGVDVSRHKSEWSKRNAIRSEVELTIENPKIPAFSSTRTSERITEGQYSTYGPIRSGETLGEIVKKFRKPAITTSQLLVAVLQANSHAFVKGNMNRLKKGVSLKIPDEEYTAGISPAEARSIERMQYKDYLNGGVL